MVIMDDIVSKKRTFSLHLWNTFVSLFVLVIGYCCTYVRNFNSILPTRTYSIHSTPNHHRSSVWIRTAALVPLIVRLLIPSVDILSQLSANTDESEHSVLVVQGGFPYHSNFYGGTGCYGTGLAYCISISSTTIEYAYEVGICRKDQ